MFLAALCGCQSATVLSPLVYEPGVSAELAQFRKQAIKDLRYDLSFSIPAEKHKPVQGEVTVSFRIDAPQELLLDFKADAKQLKSVSINGKVVGCAVVNEHITLPRSAMRKGVNAVRLSFIAGDQSLNRNADFLYTLLVPDRARTLFPCFEQPNLKAAFTLTLDVPTGWLAVSNTYVAEETVGAGRKTITFVPTEPLSTYLFSFVAGRLNRREYSDGTRKIAAYYRETDPRKVAQLDTIFKQVAASLRWQEDFTGIKYPFAKYDFVILPGFQYGGMEHTGATLYNDTQLFLGDNPTLDEELSRTQLIAHETSHMWFGDYVTMDWFDDVWTKEVFANYFAAMITQPLFPQVNHRLNWLKSYASLALAEDRTPGTTSIRQPLDDLQNAGLIYGKIVYDKAPVMMEKVVELMGKDKFREGIQEYLRAYAYGNATWDDLIRILDSKTSHDLKAFSDVWVNQKGMPAITFRKAGNSIVVSQRDPFGRGLLWPQEFNVTVVGEGRDTTATINMGDSVYVVPLAFTPEHILPNTDGRGYGLLMPDADDLQWLLAHWQDTADETARQSLLMLLNENYHAKRVSDGAWTASLLAGLRRETNPLIASTLTGCLALPLSGLSGVQRDAVECEMFAMSQTHALPSCRIQLLRSLAANVACPRTTRQLRQLWEAQSEPLLSERDYTTMTYEMAIRYPAEADSILAAQRRCINDPDRLRQFDFISRAAVADTLRLDSLFQSLLKAENRRTEPWAASALSYLSHPARGKYAIKCIRPALDALREVQRTGDIFFPRSWVEALLGRHTSREAYNEVRDFLAANPNYPPLLRNKILQAAYPLYRRYAAY